MNQPTLEDLWIQQAKYNASVKSMQERSHSEWMTNYILGCYSELGELLEEMKWKIHRSHSSGDMGPNVVDELADITKYVISMWQQIGFGSAQMIHHTYGKGEILDQLLNQETCEAMYGCKIAMLDLDGTIADFREGFMEWLKTSRWKNRLEIREQDIGLHIDLNNGWDFRNYNRAKKEFEEEGGYARLPVIENMRLCVNSLAANGWHIIVYTARPFQVYKQIWGETWRWLRSHGLIVHELQFGYDARVERAQNLAEDNMVIALEDDPTLIKRYISSGIHTWIYAQSYNYDSRPDSPLTHIIYRMDSEWGIYNDIRNTMEGETV